MPIHKPIEQAVINEVEQLLAFQEQCSCDQCKADITALALRKLPNKYSSTLKGEVLLKLELQSSQLQLDIFTAVKEAARVVKDKPHH